MGSQILFSIMSLNARRRTQLEWSSLPADAVEAISTRIPDDADYVRFRSVCSWWWRVTPPRRPRLPWLLLDYRVDAIDNLGLGLCNFPNPDFSSPPRLPQGIIDGNAICGSSRGWIAVLDESPAITLHNPFTGLRIDLPPPTNFPWINKSDQGYLLKDRVSLFYDITRFFATKLLLSSDPRTSHCMVLAFSNNFRRLIYCRPGDSSWTVLPPFIDDTHILDDIIFYNGKFYIVRTYQVFVVDVGPSGPHVSEILPADPLFSDRNARQGYTYNKTSYLVESSGNLLLAAFTNPHFECDDPKCVDCDEFSLEVFRIDLDFAEPLNGCLTLTRQDHLGGRCLFLGPGSMSISADSSPLCKGNCVYFIPAIELTLFGVFVFSMEDGKVSSLSGFSDGRTDDWEMNWLTPSLC